MLSHQPSFRWIFIATDAAITHYYLSSHYVDVKISFCTGQPWNMIGRLIFVQVKVTFCISENSLYWLVRCSITLKTQATGAKESCDVARWECWYLSKKFCTNKTHSLTRSNNEVFIYFWTRHLCVNNWLVHLYKLHKCKSASGSLFHAWNPYGFRTETGSDWSTTLFCLFHHYVFPGKKMLVFYLLKKWYKKHAV